MAVLLNWEMTQGPADGLWRFGGTITSDDGSDVDEIFTEPLPHEEVVRIFEAAVGALPANGVGLTEVTQHWDVLEQPITTEIARRLGVQ
jgi:hypothetical protein